MSIQIMNPEALQTTEGIVYMGVSNTQFPVGGRNETWKAFGDKFIQYQNPRLCSAGKLALRGVQVNSYPLNMAIVSEFAPLALTPDESLDFSWTSNNPAPAGWAPIMVVNPNLPNGPDLEFLVTMEWRVRFDLDNPASSGHTQHPTAPDSLWERLMMSASSRGNGVIDIPEMIADLGTLAADPTPMNTLRVLQDALHFTRAD